MSEATPADLAGQQDPPADVVPDTAVEASDADVVEQSAALVEQARATTGDGETPLEVDPVDAAEQASEVELDSDERR